MVAIAGFTKDQILSAVREMYSEVANLPSNISNSISRPAATRACSSAILKIGSIAFPPVRLNRLLAWAFPSAPTSYGQAIACSTSAPGPAPTRSSRRGP